jgi:pimeloyl-ACP methyl ester carboxylesterase
MIYATLSYGRDTTATVIMLSQRGYNQSSAPLTAGSYALSKLVADAASVLTQIDVKAHVVAHDWGGPVAWGQHTLVPC